MKRTRLSCLRRRRRRLLRVATILEVAARTAKDGATFTTAIHPPVNCSIVAKSDKPGTVPKAELALAAAALNSQGCFRSKCGRDGAKVVKCLAEQSDYSVTLLLMRRRMRSFIGGNEGAKKDLFFKGLKEFPFSSASLCSLLAKWGERIGSSYPAPHICLHWPQTLARIESSEDKLWPPIGPSPTNCLK